MDIWSKVGVGRRAGWKNLPVSGGVWVVGLSGEVWMARRLGWEMRGLYIKIKAIKLGKQDFKNNKLGKYEHNL